MKLKITYKTKNNKIEEVIKDVVCCGSVVFGFGIVPIKELKQWAKTIYGIEILSIEKI